MDTVSIWLTGKLLHSKTTTLKTALAAVISAGLSTVLTAIGPPEYVSLISGVISSAVMCLITFGKEKFSVFIKRLSALWIVGILLGGLMTLLMSGGSSHVLNAPVSNSQRSAVALIPIAVIVCALLLHFLSRMTSKKKTTVEVKVFGTIAILEGLVDSGNLLRDPLTGEPVIVVSYESSLKFISPEEAHCISEGVFIGECERLASRYRVVPAIGIEGQTTLNCIRPDSVKISGKNCTAIIAISSSHSLGAEIDCIVPAMLL